MLAYPVTLRKLGRESGFTLLEILVVVLIIGVIMTVAVLSLSLAGDDRQITREARRFMSLIEVAQDEAMLQGREFGLELMSGSYRFVEYDPVGNQWIEIFDDDYLGIRELPEEMEFHLFIEGRQILLDIDPADVARPDDSAAFGSVGRYAPHIFIFSSGDRTPFELHFVRSLDNGSVVLESDLLGKFEVLAEEDRS